MALLKPKLEIGLGLDKLGLDKGLQGAQKGLSGLAKAAAKPIGIFGRLKNAIAGVFGRGLGIATGLGLYRLAQKIGGAFESLLKSSLDFEAEMRNVNSVAQYGDKAFAQLTDSVLQLAEDPRITDMPAALAAGLYTLVSSGYSASDSMLILKAAAIGATAGMSTTAVASDVLASTLGAYGKTAADATATMNTLFQIVNISKYTFDQLASSLSSVTPAAASLGVSLDEVGAAMATMGKQGTDAQRATVQLNGILTALLKPTDEMTRVLAANGYASGQAAIQALGFSGVLQLLEAAINGSDTEAAALFGDVRALRGILQLTTQDGTLYNDNLDAMSHAQDGAGATAKALKEQMKSARFQLNLLHKNVVLFFTEGLGLGSAKKLAAFIAMFNRFFTRLFKLRREFNSLKAFLLSLHILLHNLFGKKVGDAFFEGIREGIRIFRLFRQVIEKDWTGAWKTLQRIGRDMNKFFGWLWGSIKDAYNAINWNKVGSVIATGLGIAWAYAVNSILPWIGMAATKAGKWIWAHINWDAVGSVIWTGLKIAYRWMTKAALPWLKKTSNTLMSKAWKAIDWDAVKKDILKGFEGMWKHPELFSLAIAGAVAIILGPIGGVIAGLIALGLIANRDKIFQALKDAMSYAVNKVKALPHFTIEVVVKSDTKHHESFADRVVNEFKALPGQLKKIFFDIPAKIGQWVGDIGTVLALKLLNAFTGSLSHHWKDYLKIAGIALIAAVAVAFAPVELIIGAVVALGFLYGFIKGILKHGDEIVIILRTIWMGWGIIFHDIWSGLGGDVVDGFLGGVWAKLDTVYKSVSDFFGKVISWVEGLLGISSPSTVAAGWGGSLIDGFVQGLTDKISDLTTWLSNNLSPSAIAVYLGDWYSNAILWGESLVNGLEQGISNKWQGFVDWLSGMWNALPGYLKKIWESLSPSKVFARIGEGAMDGLAMGFDKGSIGAYKMLAKHTNAMTMNLSGRFSPAASGGSIATSATAGDHSRTTNSRVIQVHPGAIVVHSNDGKQVARDILRFIDLVEAGQAP